EWLFCGVKLDFYFFFFFQAEDGIRDLTVTGVQTCALPISRRAVAAVISRAAARPSSPVHALAQPLLTTIARATPPERDRCSRERSEERRVGKECRAGWAQ